MLKIELSVDEIDYEGIISYLFPMIFKNKLTCKAAIHTAISKLKNKSKVEKDAYVSALINEHKQAIIEKINIEADKIGIKLLLSDIISDTK